MSGREADYRPQIVRTKQFDPAENRPTPAKRRRWLQQQETVDGAHMRFVPVERMEARVQCGGRIRGELRGSQPGYQGAGTTSHVGDLGIIGGYERSGDLWNPFCSIDAPENEGFRSQRS